LSALLAFEENLQELRTEEFLQRGEVGVGMEDAVAA
jgi:hypothetical protein